MNINGNTTRNPFDQNLNTTDDVDFARVDVSDAITDNQQLATKLYVDNNGGKNGLDTSFNDHWISWSIYILFAYKSR